MKGDMCMLKKKTGEHEVVVYVCVCTFRKSK
jgi:hypothetical protein